jgi:ligand-binding SRPBCC domain-containing protein
MPTLEMESTIAAPLEKVWAFYNDPRGALPMLSPPDNDARIEDVSGEPVGEGTRVTISMQAGRLIRKRVTWVAKIVEHRPPHAVAFGMEARFVDVQETGPFAAWRHSHEFEAVDSKTTRMVDRVTYRAPLGPIGWIADLVFLRRSIRAGFRYRHEQTKRHFESA